MVSFAFTARRHHIRLASAPFTSFRLANLIELRLLTSVCNSWQRSRMQSLRSKTVVLFKVVCGPKFIIFSNNVGDPLAFQRP